MNSKPEYLSSSEYDFFRTLYQENKDKEQDRISFENFSDIIYANKNINKQLLPEILTKVKAKIEKKRDISKGFYLSKIIWFNLFNRGRRILSTRSRHIQRTGSKNKL